MNLWIVEKFLEDGVYYFLVDLDVDIFEFIPYLFGAFKVYDIEGNIIADAFSNDLLHYTYHHIVFLDLFRP